MKKVLKRENRIDFGGDTLNHIKYNFDVLERDYLPEEQDLRRDEHQER